jgi:hypothetical protein
LFALNAAIQLHFQENLFRSTGSFGENKISYNVTDNPHQKTPNISERG